MNILVTGGAGFIGSSLVRRLLTTTTHQVINLDVLSYAADTGTLAALDDDPNHTLIEADTRDRAAVFAAFERTRPDAVIHLAGESHVDRSLQDPGVFEAVNIDGTRNLLDASLEFSDSNNAEGIRFLDVSSAEVYGLPDAGAELDESAVFAPVSPYACSKAAASELCLQYHRQHGLWVISSFCCNTYGPGQHIEKFIPKIVTNALAGNPITVYGDGSQQRCWLYVEDHVDAILALLDKGRPGQRYNIDSDDCLANLELVERICSRLDSKHPAKADSYRDLVEFVDDRPGHGSRGSLDDNKLRQETGWRPATGFEQGLGWTIDWYLDRFTEIPAGRGVD